MTPEETKGTKEYLLKEEYGITAKTKHHHYPYLYKSVLAAMEAWAALPKEPKVSAEEAAKKLALDMFNTDEIPTSEFSADVGDPKDEHWKDRWVRHFASKLLKFAEEYAAQSKGEQQP